MDVAQPEPAVAADEALNCVPARCPPALAYLFQPRPKPVLEAQAEVAASELDASSEGHAAPAVVETPSTAPGTPPPPAAPSSEEEEARTESGESRRGPTAVPAVLGIRSSRCAGCRRKEALTSRVCADVGKLYCQECWAAWERSGWWQPAIRISSAPPKPGPGGVPLMAPEDAFFLPAFLCAHDDVSLLETLQSELPQGQDFTEWHGARHMGIQYGEGAQDAGTTMMPAMRATVDRMEKAFGIRAYASRLNLYRSNIDYKPLHFDRGRDSRGVPQVTVGASFGATRELTLVHVKSGVGMTFPQQNGDVFAFTPELNSVFMHGVPKVPREQAAQDGPRLSLIIWGARLGDIARFEKEDGQVASPEQREP